MAGVRGQANRNYDRERQGVPAYLLLLPPHWLSPAAGPGSSQAAENRTA